jgi:hypothetical protein
MKKVLVTVAALGLVLGVTATAFALDQPGKAAEVEATTAPVVPQPTAPGVALWSVTGSWTLAGAYLSDGYGAPGGAVLCGDDESSADPFYLYNVKVNPVLQVNDKISVHSELRFADRTVFGATDTAQVNPLYDSDGPPSATRAVGGRLIDTYLLYMEWMSPFGKTRFGRTPAGAWGSKFLDNAAQGNRLMIWLNMLPENWGSLLFTQKISEGDAAENALNPGGYGINSASDQDRDGYYVDLSYKADFGKTVGALFFVRNASSPSSDPYTSANFWLFGNYNFAPITLEYEVNWGFGEASATSDQKQLGLYGDLGYKMQDWTFGVAAAYASGDDNPADDTDQDSMMSNATGMGRDFNPTNILFGDYMNILNGDNNLAGDTINSAIKTSSSENAGAWLVKGYASFAMSPAMSVNGYLAYAAATDEPAGYASDYGFEAGIGMGYKIMDNLMYNAHFSYLWTGDFFQEGDSSASTNDVYLVAHALSMSF